MRRFRKCGISLPINGSQDAEIHIKDVSRYKAPNCGQFISFDPKDPDGHFDYNSSDSMVAESDDSNYGSEDDIETLQLGEYVLK